MAYIDVPIDTDPQDVAQDAFTFMQAVIPGWDANSPNLDVWIIQALATAAAESRDVASRVPTSIFRWFGANLAGIQPVDATSATVNVTFTMKDNAGYTVPANTILGIPAPNADQIAFQTLADLVVPPGSTTVTAQVVAVTPGADGSGLGANGVAAALITPLDFITTAIMQGTTTGGVDAEDDATYLGRLAADLTLLAPRPILPADFAIFARNIAGVFRATAVDGYNPFHNLLTANQASIETDATGWASLLNATVARSTAQAADGIASLSLTSVAAGDMQAGTNPVTTVTVNPGETITALASFRSAVTARSCRVSIRWYTAAQVFISQSDGAAANDSAAAWTAYSVTAVAPATAGLARVVVTVLATGAASEVHYVDKASVRRGFTTDWVPGGTGETGQPRTVSVASQDSLGNPVSSTVKNAIDADLQARREVNFLVYEIDATISLVNVTYQVVAQTGVDKVALLADINAALNAYLNPATWGATEDDAQAWNNVSSVYYLELASVINNVPGVDRITTTGGNYDLTVAINGFTMARSDVVLPGAVPLPDANTITGTVL